MAESLAQAPPGEEWMRVTTVELVWPGKYNARGERRAPAPVPRLPLVREMVCNARRPPRRRAERAEEGTP